MQDLVLVEQRRRGLAVAVGVPQDHPDHGPEADPVQAVHLAGLAGAAQVSRRRGGEGKSS